MNQDRFADKTFRGDRHKGTRVGTIWRAFGSGDVTLSADFDGLHPIEQADILQDAIELLKVEYQQALTRMRHKAWAPDNG